MSKRTRNEVDDDFDVGDGQEGWFGGFASILPSAATGRQLLIAAVVLGVLVGGVVFAWQKFGPQITAGPAYRLQPNAIEVSQQPPWIHADVKAEVIRDGSLTNLDLLDPQVTVRIAQAFATHSWVAEVRRVSKHHPAKVVVEVVYRKPVAMVEVEMEVEINGKRVKERGLLPVDVGGVLLPTEDFSPNEAREYARVSAGGKAPAGPVGTPWGDPRVAGAAKIAAAFGDRWRELALYRIVAVPDPVSGRLHGEPNFELTTKPGVRILWGHPPGEETSGEASAAQKITRLQQFVAEYGPLDSSLNGTQQIDLRDGQQIRPSARTARRERE